MAAPETRGRPAREGCDENDWSTGAHTAESSAIAGKVADTLMKLRTKEHAGIVDDVARLNVVSAIHHDVVIGQEFLESEQQEE